MHIAVIDDGIVNKLYNLGNLKYDIEINNKRIKKRKNNCLNLTFHGTTCAAIIKKYGLNVSLTSIKIINGKTNSCHINDLIMAIEWCIEKKIKIINMSIGSIDFRDFQKLRSCFKNAYENGLIIVAASNNSGFFTYTACSSNVIGVKCDRRYKDDQFKVIRISFKGIDIIASGKHLLKNSDDEFYTNPSNSFAAPLITAFVNNIIEEDNSLSFIDIKRRLFDMSLDKGSNIKYYPQIYSNIDFAHNVIYVKDINRGQNDFQNYNKYLNIKKIININSGNKDECLNKTRKSLSDICLTNIDSIILNITEDKDLLNSIIMELEKIIKSNFYIILLNNTLIDKELLLNIEKGKIWSISFYKKALLSSRSKKIDIPTIALYNYTSNNIFNKYFFEINKLFRDEGYYSIPISSEIEHILEGVEYVPFDINLDNFLSVVYNKYICDLLIVAFDTNYLKKRSYPQFYNNMDVEVYIGENKQEVNILCSEKDIYKTFPLINSNKNIEKVYYEILNCFV